MAYTATEPFFGVAVERRALETRALIRVIALFLLCFGAPLLLVLRLQASDAPETRTPDTWASALRTRNSEQRAMAMYELSQLTQPPELPCALLVDKLSDLAEVRAFAVPVLVKATSRGRCIGDVAAALRDSSGWWTRVAAAQVFEATRAAASDSTVRTALQMAAVFPDRRVQDAVRRALGAIAH